MDPQFGSLLLALLIPVIAGLIQCIRYIVFDKPLDEFKLWFVAEAICLAIYPFLYFQFAVSGPNDCCNGDPPALATDHKLSIIIVIVLVVFSYFLSKSKKDIISPGVEVFENCMLLIGIVLNILLMVQMQKEVKIFVYFHSIIILYLLMALHKNHALYTRYINENIELSSPSQAFLHKVLSFEPVIKYPLLLFLCVPVLIVIALLLLLLGQKPDSMIQAFTDTYHHTFSIHDCTNVQCPHGHYLCTIAANGHKEVVRPVRPGIRYGNVIKVNRQLLIANAFEELLEEYVPALHKPIRHNYDKVGVALYSSQKLLNNKWIADAMYYAMKPLEWLFIITLYIFDKKPENRIARQYISNEHRAALKKR